MSKVKSSSSDLEKAASAFLSRDLSGGLKRSPDILFTFRVCVKELNCIDKLTHGAMFAMIWMGKSPMEGCGQGEWMWKNEIME